MILLAAWKLEQEGQSPFTAETLIVTSWQKFPRTFGLKGYTDQYPDSNKVLASIMGQRGLTGRAWLVKMGEKLYALTREGRQVVRSLLQDDATAPPEEEAVDAVSLTREQERFLQNLVTSTAFQKIQEDRKAEIKFADACRFWSITENLQGDALDARLRSLEKNLADVKRQVGTATATLSTGRQVTADDIAQLSQVHSFLEDRFDRHLTLLRNRSGRN
jgi:hypothetical protein